MSKPYSELTVPERWTWHAEIYAFRRVAQGVPPEEQTSPCDPSGVWFDAGLVDAAERRMRDKRDADSRERRARRLAHSQPINPADALPVMDQWAREHGYADLADYQERERLDYVDARANIARSFIAAAVVKSKEAFADPAATDRAAALAALGVKAREYKPTAEQLRAGRIALGIEEPEPLAMAAE